MTPEARKRLIERDDEICRKLLSDDLSDEEREMLTEAKAMLESLLLATCEEGDGP